MYRKDKILPIIIQTIVLDLNETESLKYLEDKGFKISARYLYRLKNKVKSERFHRLSLIAQAQFRDQHIQRIETLEVINSEYWQLYRQEKVVWHKARILEKITELQTYISSYYDASRYILEKQMQESTTTTQQRKRKKTTIDNEQQ